MINTYRVHTVNHESGIAIINSQDLRIKGKVEKVIKNLSDKYYNSLVKIELLGWDVEGCRTVTLIYKHN